MHTLFGQRWMCNTKSSRRWGQIMCACVLRRPSSPLPPLHWLTRPCVNYIHPFIHRIYLYILYIVLSSITLNTSLFILTDMSSELEWALTHAHARTQNHIIYVLIQRCRGLSARINYIIPSAETSILILNINLYNPFLRLSSVLFRSCPEFRRKRRKKKRCVQRK